MTSQLTLIRAAWLASIPLSELLAPCRTEMFRTLAIHWYGEMDMLAFLASPRPPLCVEI